MFDAVALNTVKAERIASRRGAGRLDCARSFSVYHLLLMLDGIQMAHPVLLFSFFWSGLCRARHPPRTLSTTLPAAVTNLISKPNSSLTCQRDTADYIDEGSIDVIYPNGGLLLLCAVTASPTVETDVGMAKQPYIAAHVALHLPSNSGPPFGHI